nr:MAG TPA: hypothetical protein [Caudoviricetes sp.]
MLCAKIRCFFESTKYLATNLIQTLVLQVLLVGLQLLMVECILATLSH